MLETAFDLKSAGFELTVEEKNHDWTSGRIVFGVFLSLAFCFVVASVVSYSPQDPPSQTYVALQQPVHNVCGAPGAFCANLLYRFCGYGVWFLLIPLFLRLISFWRMPRLSDSVLKVLGTFLMLTAFSGLLSSFLPRYSAEPAPMPSAASEDETAKTPTILARFAAQQTELGPGGELGAVTRFLLDKKLRIAPAGIAVFLVFLFAAGAILASNSPLLRLLLQVTGLQAAAEVFVSSEKRKKPVPEPAIVPVSDSRETAAPEEPVGESDEDGDDDMEDNGEEEDEEDGDEKPAQYVLPPMEILPYAEVVDRHGFERRLEAEMRRLQKAFDDYGCDVRVAGYQTGPVITLFELELSKGQKLSQLRSLENELAIAMKVPSVRVVFPIPGKSSVGVEVPNKDRQLVRLRNVMEESAEAAAKMQIPIFIGKDATGDPIVADLAKLPHLLIAGRTGTGKSVCLNSIILSILMTKSPAQVRLVMIDPKMVELSPYKNIPHLMHPVLTDMKRATAVLRWLCDHMDERYNLLADVGVRQLKEYNRLSEKQLFDRYQPKSDEEWARVPRRLSAIVVIADEMADMMAIAGKEVQEYIARLAAKSRAVGIHLILATQKPTVDVVTGLIKSNLPARIAFGVASNTDSRVILDDGGADKLLGNGDLLFLNSVTNQIIRGQGTYIDDDEVYAVNCEIATEKHDFVVIDTDEEAGVGDRPRRVSSDPLYSKAVEMILTQRQASTSFLQRRFSIGYGRAAKIIDAMEDEGLLGPKTSNDSKGREILKTFEEWKAGQREDQPRQIQPPRASIPMPKNLLDGLPDDEEEETPRQRLYPAHPAEDGLSYDDSPSDEEYEEYGDKYAGGEAGGREWDEDSEEGDGTGDEFSREDEFEDDEQYEEDGNYGEESDERFEDEYDGDFEEDEEYIDGEGDFDDSGENIEEEPSIDPIPKPEHNPPKPKPPRGESLSSDASRGDRPRPNLRDLARRRKFRKQKRREGGEEELYG